MRYNLLLFFLFLNVAGNAQEDSLLKGQILADSLIGSSINIVNLTKEIGTTNSGSGEFEIEATVGDTLLFSSVQYEVREIVISKEILEKGFLKVELSFMMNELDEVRISNISLSGNLTADLNNIETFDQASVGFPMSTKPRLTSIERKIYTASSSSLMLLVNMLNGRLKMLKRAQKNMEFENLIDLGVDIFPTEFFTDIIHVPENMIRLFVYYCGEDSRYKELMINREALPLIELYMEKAIDFRKLHNISAEGALDLIISHPDDINTGSNDSISTSKIRSLIEPNFNSFKILNSEKNE
ncbi:hypothetical protein [Salinimicrobium gaetbulicola]|uniref:Carboxypeptidase-like protein n=1 Tax=Salinimicrobium gaetbulicola TaxID=999702 RepID=A0ABW3IDQ2_9FLAO